MKISKYSFLIAGVVAGQISSAQSEFENQVKQACKQFAAKMGIGISSSERWSIRKTDTISANCGGKYIFYLNSSSLKVTLYSNDAEDARPHKHAQNLKPFYNSEQELWDYAMQAVYTLFGSDCGLQPSSYSVLHNSDVTRSGLADLLSLNFVATPFGYPSQGFGNAATIDICRTNGTIALAVGHTDATFKQPSIKYSESEAKSIVRKEYPDMDGKLYAFLSYYPSNTNIRVYELAYLVSDSGSSVAVSAQTGIVLGSRKYPVARKIDPKMQLTLGSNSKKKSFTYTGKYIKPRKISLPIKPSSLKAKPISKSIKTQTKNKKQLT